MNKKLVSHVSSKASKKSILQAVFNYLMLYYYEIIYAKYFH